MSANSSTFHWLLVCVVTFSLRLPFLTTAHQIRFKNNCPFTVWPGILANFGFLDPENGGFRLNSGSERPVEIEHEWGGEIWGRTVCDDTSGRCQTGDCGDQIECDGSGGSPPINFVDIKFDGILDLDYYFLSLVDGYNLPLAILPVPGTVEDGNSEDPLDCQPIGCWSDLNLICPPELVLTPSRDDGENRTMAAVIGLETNEVIACMSPCVAFDTDEYCCRGVYDDPLLCRGELWPIRYTVVVKTVCPTAFSYVHDRTTRSSTCRSLAPDSSKYEIIFCP